MELTQEQLNIINSVHTDDHITKVNAYAGTGKTSTIIELVKEIKKTDPNANIAYLVYNTNMKDEAKAKFEELNLDVNCYTAHGLAYRNYSIRHGKFELITTVFGTDYMNLLKREFRGCYIPYGSINQIFEAYGISVLGMDDFCEDIKQNDYLHKDIDCEIKPEYLEFFKRLYNVLLEKNKLLHSMYLKEYAINDYDRIKQFDYVFVDEAQDLNPHMMAIVRRMVCKKIWYFGDFYQQIYTFTGAINAMEQVEGTEYPLSMSFRLNNETRKLANKILNLQYKDFKDKVQISNLYDLKESTNKNKITVLFRTNVAMIDYTLSIIDFCNKYPERRVKVSFMDCVGGKATNSFDKTFESMLYLFRNLLHPVNREKFDQHFKTPKRCSSIDFLIKLAEKADVPLGTYMIEHKDTLPPEVLRMLNLYVVINYDLVNILNKLKSLESTKNPTDEYYLCTAHRSKGREWENVIIAPDKWSFKDPNEANLIYVACTRATKTLDWSSLSRLLGVVRAGGKFIGDPIVANKEIFLFEKEDLDEETTY